jgi:hypothetical protein
VGAAGAFLGDVEALIEINHIVRAGIDAELAAGALFGIDDHHPVVALIDRVEAAVGDAGRVVAVVAHIDHIGDL